MIDANVTGSDDTYSDTEACQNREIQNFKQRRMRK